MSKVKLEQFTASIIDDANLLARQMLEDIKKERDTAIAAAEDEFLSETYRHIKNEVSRIKTRSGQQVSKKVLECKRILYSRREAIAADVLEKLNARLREYVVTPTYKTRLLEIAGSVAAAIKSEDEIIYLCERDMAFKDELVPFFSKGAEFKSGYFEIGGLVAESPSRHLRVDQSFDTALAEKTGHLAELLELGITE